MSKYKQWLISVIVICIIIAFILVIVKQEQEKVDYESVEFLIGVSHANLVEEWQIALHEDVKNKANGYNNIKLISTNAGNSSFKQIDDLDKLMDYGINLLIITINEATALKSTIEEIGEKIPVILVDENIDSGAYALNISPDYYDIGVKAASRFLEIADGKEFKVLTVNGSIDNDTVIMINQGFQDTVITNPLVSIENQIYLDLFDNEGMELMEETIIYQEFDGVYVQSAEIVLEVIEALKKYEKQVPIVVSGKFISDKFLTYVDIGDIDTYLYTPLGASEALEYGMRLLTKEEHKIPKRITMNTFIISNNSESEYQRVDRDINKVIGLIDTDLFDEKRLIESLSTHWRVNYFKRNGSTDLDIIHQQQLDDFQEILKSEADIIIFEPLQLEGWEELIYSAFEQGITIICLGNKSVYDLYKNQGYMIYIGPDYDDQSKRIASYLINQVYSTEYDIGILEITDGFSYQNFENKSESLNKQISGYSRINTITKVNMDISEEKSIFEEDLRNVFLKYENDINVIYVHNDLFIDRVEKILDSFSQDQKVIIGSNNTGILHDNPFIDYQVTTDPIYEDQLLLISDNYYEKGFLNLAEIYLPNKFDD